MVKSKRSQRGRRGNVLVLITLLVPTLVGLAGLAIDGTMVFIVQTELSAAVDGAALGTGRLLTSLTTNAQAQGIATEYLNANFRLGQPGFWGSYVSSGALFTSADVTANVTGITKTVQVTASVQVPLLFMRIFGQNASTVSATGTATRRDARIELIIDRSGSMQALLPNLKTYAETFTQGFTEGSDELGLIVFSDSGVVAYPPTTAPPYSPYLTAAAALAHGGASTCPAAPCGPDTSFQSGASTDMLHQIANTVDQDDTNMGDALALAYIELQKAHMRDLAANSGIDSRLNVIVLFTDGVPNTVSVYLNNPNDPRSPVMNGTGTTGCAVQVDNVGPPAGGNTGLWPKIGNHPLIGLVEATTGTSFFQLTDFDPTFTSAQQVAANPANDEGNYVSYPNPGTCTQNKLQNLQSLAKIPSLDAYGYPLWPNTETGTNGYEYSYYLNRVASQAPIIYSNIQWGASTAPQPMNYNTNNNTTGASYQWTLAAWDAVDNIASAIRTDSNWSARADGTANPMAITIMTIGYTGDGGTDEGLLSKVANISGCSFNGYSCYMNNQPSGIFVPASNTAELSAAMSTILSAILRLQQ